MKLADARDDAQRDRNPQGQYANYLEVGQNRFEFLLDFGQAFVEAEKPRIHSRIITSPVGAKGFLETLGKSIAQYEEEHGPIPPEGNE